MFTKKIHPNEITSGDQKGVIVDIRTALEYGHKRLSGSHIHHPLDEKTLDKMVQSHGLANTPIYLLCRSGH